MSEFEATLGYIVPGQPELRDPALENKKHKQTNKEQQKSLPPPPRKQNKTFHK